MIKLLICEIPKFLIIWHFLDKIGFLFFSRIHCSCSWTSQTWNPTEGDKQCGRGRQAPGRRKEGSIGKVKKQLKRERSLQEEALNCYQILKFLT